MRRPERAAPARIVPVGEIDDLWIAIAVHTFVVRYEEPKLRALFGAEYDAYAAQVDRWLPRRLW